MIWLPPILAAISFVLGLLLLRAADARELRHSLMCIELRFPKDQEEGGVQAFLGSISGLLPPWWRRWWHTPFIVSEVLADRTGTRHRLLVPRRFVRHVEAALAAHLPAVAYDEKETFAYPALNVAAEYRLTSAERSLAIDGTSLSAGLLSSLHPLFEHESIVVQVLFAPARPVAPARMATAEERDLQLDDGVVLTSEAASALRKKRSAPLLLTTLRIGVMASSTVRRHGLLRDAEATWHATRAPGTLLKRRLVTPTTAAQRITTVWRPLNGWPVLLNSSEAAGLVGYPINATSLPGVEFGASRPLPVPTEVPRFGTILGEGTHPRSRRPVGIDPVGRTHHSLIIGPTGSGKSVLLAHLAEHDAEAGHALVVIDPKDGDLVDAVAARLPAARLEDVIVFDPTDDRPVGFDPLRSSSADRELVVDRVLGLMVDIWQENLGPRSADILRHVLLTIAAHPHLTMAEAPRLLVDQSFRHRMLAAHDPGPEVRGWWDWADNLSTGEWSAMTGAPLNKLRAFVGRSPVAHTIGQTGPAIDFGRVLNDRQILLVRLPVGLLGDETTALLGAMLINQLWHAIAARAAVPKALRRPVSVIVDEVGTVLRFPASSIDTMLTQARGYGVGVTLAGQHLSQLPSDLRAAALTNARTKVVFATGRDDAGVFARELGHGLTADDVMGIAAFHAIAAVHAAGRTQTPATIRTLPSEMPLRSASEVRASSRQRWGVDRGDIDTARRQRVEAPAETGADRVGRKRRRPT
ncbi:MAG: type IV secretion system DNA-binding domain-containing protein [Sulfitobacter sp.]|nr:type IV secretion system DNA-binding domain-containing protein [Sulfitobacter sp.]